MEGEQLEWNDGQHSLETVHRRRNLQATKRVFPDVLVSLLTYNDGAPLQLEEGNSTYLTLTAHTKTVYNYNVITSYNKAINRTVDVVITSYNKAINRTVDVVITSCNKAINRTVDVVITSYNKAINRTVTGCYVGIGTHHNISLGA